MLVNQSRPRRCVGSLFNLGGHGEGDGYSAPETLEREGSAGRKHIELRFSRAALALSRWLTKKKRKKPDKYWAEAVIYCRLFRGAPTALIVPSLRLCLLRCPLSHALEVGLVLVH